MIQVKLKTFLDTHDVSVYELVQAIVEETDSLSEASVYKIASGNRNPSLASLDLIVTALRQLTGHDVQLQDIVKYTPETDEMGLQENHDELTEVWQLVKAQMPLIPITEPTTSAQVLDVAPYRTRKRKPLRTALVTATVVGALCTLSLEPRSVSPPSRAASEPITTMGIDHPPPQLLATNPTSLTPTLHVVPESDAVAYEFQLVNKANENTLISMVVPESAYKIPPTYLCAGNTYAWTARTQTATGWSSYAPAIPFQFAGQPGRPSDTNPPAPTALYPSGTITTLTPLLRVSNVKEARHYGFYVRNLDSGALVYADEFSTSSTHRLPEGVLEPGTRYRWNAQTRNCAGFSTYSQRFEFQTAPDS